MKVCHHFVTFLPSLLKRPHLWVCCSCSTDFGRWRLLNRSGSIHGQWVTRIKNVFSKIHVTSSWRMKVCHHFVTFLPSFLKRPHFGFHCCCSTDFGSWRLFNRSRIIHGQWATWKQKCFLKNSLDFIMKQWILSPFCHFFAIFFEKATFVCLLLFLNWFWLGKHVIETRMQLVSSWLVIVFGLVLSVKQALYPLHMHNNIHCANRKVNSIPT